MKHFNPHRKVYHRNMAQNAKASMQRLQPPNLGRCRESWGMEKEEMGGS